MGTGFGKKRRLAPLARGAIDSIVPRGATGVELERRRGLRRVIGGHGVRRALVFVVRHDGDPARPQNGTIVVVDYCDHGKCSVRIDHRRRGARVMFGVESFLIPCQRETGLGCTR